MYPVDIYEVKKHYVNAKLSGCSRFYYIDDGDCKCYLCWGDTTAPQVLTKDNWNELTLQNLVINCMVLDAQKRGTFYNGELSETIDYRKEEDNSKNLFPLILTMMFVVVNTIYLPVYAAIINNPKNSVIACISISIVAVLIGLHNYKDR